MEKALADITELGETDAINNPLVTEKVQWSANYLEKGWLIVMVNLSNNVT